MPAPVRAKVIAQPDLKPCNVSSSSAPTFLRYIFKRASAQLKGKANLKCLHLVSSGEQTATCKVNLDLSRHIQALLDSFNGAPAED